jgi:hypothetical protein
MYWQRSIGIFRRYVYWDTRQILSTALIGIPGKGEKMTFKWIDYFLAVARYNNFSDAARAQFVSQPAISKQISLWKMSSGYPCSSGTDIK